MVSCAQTAGEIPSSYLAACFSLLLQLGRGRETAKKWQMITNAACRETWTATVAETLLVCWALSSLLQFRRKEFNRRFDLLSRALWT